MCLTVKMEEVVCEQAAHELLEHVKCLEAPEMTFPFEDESGEWLVTVKRVKAALKQRAR